MNLNTLRRAAVGAGALVLLGALTVVNASAAKRDHGRRTPEQPSTSGCLRGEVCVDDVLRISVEREPGLSGRYRVDPRGGIDYPFVGRLTVSGLKPSAVAKLIADSLRKVHASESKVDVEVEADQKGAKQCSRHRR
jgi:hypothetical protein